MKRKRFVILERCSYYLNSTRDFQTYWGDQLFQTEMPNEKVYECLDNHLKPVMQNGKS